MKTLQHPNARMVQLWFFVPCLIAIGVGIRGWVPQNEAKIIPLTHYVDVRSLQFSPNGQRLVVAGEGGIDHQHGTVFDVARGSKICDLELAGFVFQMSPPSWSPDSTRIVAGFTDDLKLTGKIALWDATNGHLMAKWRYAPEEDSSYAKVYFSDDGKKLIGNGRPPALFDATSGQRFQKFDSSYFPTGSGDFNKQGNLLAVNGALARQFEVRDLETNRALWHPDAPYRVGVQWAETNILGLVKRNSLESSTGSLLLWDGNKQSLLPSPSSQNVSHFALNSQAPLVAVVEAKGKDAVPVKTPVKGSNLFVWDYATQRIVWSHAMAGTLLNPLWSPDGKWLGVREEAAQKSQVWIFDANGDVLHQIPFSSRNDSWAALEWSPDSRELAIAEKADIKIVTLN